MGGEGENAGNLCTEYPPQPFFLISKAFSDKISLIKDGPSITRKFTSECKFDCERSFRTSANFVPQMVPKHFVTTLTVADDLTFYEFVAFERRTVMKRYSETSNIFLPKEFIRSNCSMLCFDPDATTIYYKVGLELLPAQKVIVETNHDDGNDDATVCDEISAINGEICEQLNGEIF